MRCSLLVAVDPCLAAATAEDPTKPADSGTRSRSLVLNRRVRPTTLCRALSRPCTVCTSPLHRAPSLANGPFSLRMRTLSPAWNWLALVYPARRRLFSSTSLVCFCTIESSEELNTFRWGLG